MRRKIYCVLLSALLLSSCGLTGSVEQLLVPPTVSEEQSEVYDALADDTGSGITLVYPRTGEHRGAFIFADTDGDGTDEAFAFYRNSSSPNVRVNLLKKNDRGWHSVYDHSGPGTGVEEVFFTDYGGDNTYMCIGFSSPAQHDKVFTVYSVENDMMTALFSEVYNMLINVDINLDGGEDTVLINSATEDHSAYALLIADKKDGSGVRSVSGTVMRSNGVEQINAVAGGISGGAAAIFVDSNVSGGISTEVLYCVEGSLRNPAVLDDSSIPALTLRRSGLSQDIDGDGVVEIPTLTPFPGYRDSDGQNMTIWNEFENYTLSKKYTSLYMPSQGYCFMLPVRWQGLVTVKTDASSGEKVFCKFNSSLSESRMELMRIISVDAASKNEYLEKGYTVAAETDTRSIMVLCTSSEDPLVLTQSEIENGMIML